MKRSFLSPLTLILCFLITACNEVSGEGPFERTLVHGTFTAGEDFESDLSGIQIVIVDRATEPADTLYSAVTDASGNFSGEAVFRMKNEYPLLVKRNNEQIASATLVLAEQDTVTITAELPDFRSTVSIESFENAALATYRRLDSQYYRIVAMINAGAVEDNDIPTHIQTWGELFWSVREDFPNTVAAERATAKSFEVLEGWDDEKNLERINTYMDDQNIQEAGIYYGTVAKLRLEGLDAAVNFLEELDRRVQDEAGRRLITMNTVELLYDSLRVDQARQVLEAQEHRFTGTEDSLWAQSMNYDLNNLAPGMTIPDFEFETTDNQNISREDLQGTPYILEVVELSSRQYQSIHPYLIELSETYSDKELRIITVPIEQSRITVSAFYDERPRPWAVAGAGTFEAAGLYDIFNINHLPTRFLVDADNNIVRRYIGNDLLQLESDIQNLNQ